MDAARSSDHEAFEIVTTAFYRHQDVELATKAFRHWLRMVAAADDAEMARMTPLGYLFGQIAKSSDAARAALVPVSNGYDGPHATIAQRFIHTGTCPGIPNPHGVAVDLPGILDLLWAEFFVTGQVAPIARIFTVLDARDHVRQRLETWLRKWSVFGGAKRRATAAALSAAGLEVDLERKVIVSEGDLDCACFSIAERRVKIFTLLPFELNQEGLDMIAAKGAALWSLRLNARDHEKVAEIVRVEAQRPGGPGRRLAAAAAGDGRPFVL